MKNIDFRKLLLEEIVANLHNNYSDNIKTYTSKHYEKQSIGSSLRKLFNFLGLDFLKHSKYDYQNLAEIIETYNKFYDKYHEIYELFEDKFSRNLFLKIISYRILGYKKYKLPLNNREYWEKFEKLEREVNFNDCVDVGFLNWKLCRFDLINNNYKIKLYYLPVGLLNTFYLKQYVCPTQIDIKAKDGDVVIDAGGCWGDTALYFASEVGSFGKVYTFEFIQSNLSIMHRNFAQNPELKEWIEIVENPLWSESDQNLYYIDNGPASQVFFNETSDTKLQVSTISIDDFIDRRGIQKVDFIKMDIEGAELFALKGATKVIKKFKPKLAISIYHSIDDFVCIPEFIHALGLGYKFYLGHFTTHLEETVLYAMSSHYKDLSEN
jgi:FkbM family methyltransferase